jgi:hypothetical protein
MDRLLPHANAAVQHYFFLTSDFLNKGCLAVTADTCLLEKKVNQFQLELFENECPSEIKTQIYAVSEHDYSIIV